MNKILILNLSTLDSNYSSVDKAGHDTWGSYKGEDVKIIHYYGKYDKNFQPTTNFPSLPPDGECLLIGDDLIVGTYDASYPNNHPVRLLHDNSPITYTYGKINDPRGEKFIIALEYCLNNFEFDFIQRSSCTSYISIPKMINYINKQPKTKVYSGARNMYNNEYYFISGHNVLMSRDVAQQLVNHKKEYLELPYPEDLAIGYLLIHHLNYTSFLEQDNYNTSATVSLESNDFELNNNPSIYSYRVRHNHSEVFHKLHNLIIKN